MVSDAEKYKAEDDKQRERVTSKNDLEAYAFQVKQTMEEDKLKDKITDEDKQAVVEKAKEVLGWLDTNQQASKEEYEDMKKELEKVAAPVMTKLYQGGQQGGMPGGMPDGFPGSQKFRTPAIQLDRPLKKLIKQKQDKMHLLNKV